MRISCSLNRHAADPRVIENDGNRFSRCTRCAADLVERAGKWVAAPKGFRIVWRSAGDGSAQAPVPAEADLLPVLADEQRHEERRRPSSSPHFGPERRRSNDRRARFGKVDTLVERAGVRITRDGAAFPTASYKAEEIIGIEFATRHGDVNLAWLLYAAVAVLTACQAAMAAHLGLWAIAGALALFSSISWQRRQPDQYDILVENRRGRTSVLQTADQGFASLVHDALASIQRQPAAR